jgi:HSP20 family protein
MLVPDATSPGVERSVRTPSSIPMTVRRWDPLRDLLSLQERMNRLFEESLAHDDAGVLTGLSAGWSPAADAFETPQGFVLEVELPGIDEEDVELTIDGQEVALKGERRLQGRPETFHRMERSYGPFARTFKLTADVDPDRVAADFRDGLLRLELVRLHTGPRG